MDRTDTPRPTYQAYLIRFWREDTHQPWRATVIRSGVEHIYHFAAFESLVTFLHQRLADETTLLETDDGNDAG